MKKPERPPKTQRSAKGAQSPLRKARTQAMLTFLEQCDEFRTDRHLIAFTDKGWSSAQVEAALNQLASSGLVELRVGLDEVPFIVASLKQRERQHGR
jgi:hypothetical protein